jgi:hypothetical protein
MNRSEKRGMISYTLLQLVIWIYKKHHEDNLIF